MQTFYFMSKNKHVLIQKVTLLSKGTLDTALHKKTCYQHTKTYVYTNQTMLYLHTSFLEYTVIDFSVSTQTVSPIYSNPFLTGLNYLVYS